MTSHADSGEDKMRQTTEKQKKQKNGYEYLMDLLYPERACTVCDTPLKDKRLLCDVCKEEYQIKEENRCDICGRPLPEEKRVCEDCKREGKIIQNTAVFFYKGEVKAALYRYKYGKNRYLGRRFAEIMAKEKAEAIKDADILIPVPIHRRRLYKRTFNQSEILAKYISKETGIPFYYDVAVRAKYTDYLANHTKEERKEILKDCFSVKKEEFVAGRRILLIDDIYTTGSTMEELGRLLLKQGAVSVKSMTVAVTEYDDME